MLKVLKMIFLFVLLVSLCASANAEASVLEHLRPETLIVSELDLDNDIVFMTDCNGNIWAIEETEDWAIGDFVSVVFHDINTEDIYDDVIIDYRYSGYFANWEEIFYGRF